MKYYFFRDLGNQDNLEDGKTYHAAGLVESVWCDDFLDPNYSGKDLSVLFFHPFEGCLISAWRAIHEVELFEVDKWEYELLVEQYKKIK